MESLTDHLKEAFRTMFSNGITKNEYETEVFKENFYVEKFANALKEILNKPSNGEKYGVRTKCSSKRELSFKKIITYDADNEEYVSKRMGGTDLVLGKWGSIYKCRNDKINNLKKYIGVEFKLFYSTRLYRLHDHFMNVAYFSSGKFSKSKNMPPSNKGAFFQDEELTFCKEGQMLTDIGRMVRVLSYSNVNKMYACGVFLYPVNYLEQKLENNIKKLIKKWICYGGAVRYEKDQKFSNYIQLTDQEKEIVQSIIGNVWIQKCGDIWCENSMSSFEKLFCYPYILKISKP